MSKEEDYDDLYEDEVNGLLDLDASNAEEEEEEEEDKGDAFSRKMFGPTGRGSPAMDRQSPYQLSRNAAASLRNAGFKDEKHLKDITAWEPQARQKPKAVVKAAAVMVKAKPSPENRNQFSDNSKYDQDAQDAADKLWLSMGHLPLRHRIGQEWMKRMENISVRPQRNKGGTRKRRSSSSSRRRSKKSIRRNKRSSKRSSRSNKKSRRK
jgi:hypothetical protein